jgi:hypothetical protein
MIRPISVVFAALLLVAGCGRSTLAPEPALESQGSTQSAGVTGSSGGGAGRGGVVSAPVPLAVGTLVPVVDPTPEWYELANHDVEAGVTRSVSGGRWELIFRPGSVGNTTEVSISCWDDKVLECELGPHGTQFGAPVELRIRYDDTRADPTCSDFDGTQPAFFWFDDARGVWVELPGVDDRQQKTYVVQLTHFSRYVLGGKAGW